MTETNGPRVVHTVEELRAAIEPARRAGRTIGLVPTMGALHEGHLSLVLASKASADVTVVSIFVNPTQFGEGEDFDAYPRTLDTDVAALSDTGADLVFAPSAGEMYGDDFSTYVVPGGPAEPLEGSSRPGHFRGVATVVLKLLNQARADVSFFGQKDYQQAAVLQQMVCDLDVPTRLIVMPIVREPDGLAMSSRNVYLDPQQRQDATVLYRSMQKAKQLYDSGERSVAAITQAVEQEIGTVCSTKIDYVALVDACSLQPIDRIERPAVLALAVRIGKTRLIDNDLLGGIPDGWTFYKQN